jgi:hypothetical protein
MRISRAVTALTATGLLAATMTGAAATTGAATTTGAAAATGTAATTAACTPSWKVVTTPAAASTPAGDTPDTQLSGVSVVSADEVWFPGSTAQAQPNGPQSWVLNWNGHALTTAAQIPQSPLAPRDDDAGGSFDSATDGWVLGTTYLLPVAYPQYAARWHDGRWTVTPLAVSPDPATSYPGLDAIDSLTPSNAWSAGAFYQGSSTLGALIEHWDGSQWSVVANPASGQPGAILNAITAVSASDIWAVGQQQNAAGVIVPLTEHWNGTRWSVVSVPAGNSPSHLLAVSADGADDVWAVGAQTEAGTSDNGVVLAEHWNGAKWTAVTGLPSLGNAELQQVYAASGTDVWATVYTVLPDSDLGVEDFVHWNGAKWTTVTAPGPQEWGLDYEYAGLAGTGPDNIWAAGYSTQTSNGTTVPLVAHLSCG